MESHFNISAGRVEPPSVYGHLDGGEPIVKPAGQKPIFYFGPGSIPTF
jgi:hypothetical protein